MTHLLLFKGLFAFVTVEWQWRQKLKAIDKEHNSIQET